MADSVAAMLLNAAREDAKAVRALCGLPDISDAILGFHAQQSVEKALKAVLSSSGIVFRRTHDIAECATPCGATAATFGDIRF